jgi:sulfate permease, SulP family
MVGGSEGFGKSEKLMMKRLALIPIFVWAGRYNKHTFVSDMIAAVIVAIMLIPQSLAYAMLAGLPAEVGLYASITPLFAYAILGTSSTLSVGPVAITSLMTATALAEVAEQGSGDYLSAAITLAALSGVMLLGFGLLRLGFLANFLSHTVVSAFITASAIIIALSQVSHILGTQSAGDNVFELLSSLGQGLQSANGYTLLIGVGGLVFLYLARTQGVLALEKLGLSRTNAQLATKAAPVIGVLLTIGITFQFGLHELGVAIVGSIPSGLPHLTLPGFSMELVNSLWLPAALISIIGYVESISVGRTLGAQKRERVNSNQELVALGAANIASAFSGAFPVTGGFSRSVVNFDAGACTQASSVYAGFLIALVSLFLTPFLYYLPKATLAATIIIAVLSLVDFSVINKTWRFKKSDWMAVVTTIVMTLGFGVEVGVSCGVMLSLGLHMYRTSKPHIAEVGQVDGTEHFRNVKRYRVKTAPEILTLRIDESLFFANATYLEELIYEQVFDHDKIAHVILMCNAMNEIDYSALEILDELNTRLLEQGILFHLSEVKGPVLDRLRTSQFVNELSGNIYLSQFEAYTDIKQRYAY